MNPKVALLNLLLLLVLFTGILSNAYSRQEARGNNNAASNGKGMPDDLHFQTSTGRSGWGGRKVGSSDSFMKGHGPCERPSKIASASRRKQSIRSLVSKEKELVGFVAFNADYKGPRHHPPKNN